MDAAGDRLLAEGDALAAGKLAKAELAVLKFVVDAEIDDRSKCQAAFMVIDGTDAGKVREFVLDQQGAKLKGTSKNSHFSGVVDLESG